MWSLFNFMFLCSRSCIFLALFFTFFLSVLYEFTSNVFFMSTFIDTPNPIFYSLLSVLCHLAFKFIYILSYFNQAVGN